jgi:hypothetical protein
VVWLVESRAGRRSPRGLGERGVRARDIWRAEVLF